jgi:hypothetical protein
MLTEFSRQLTRAMADVMQTSIDPVLILCNMANMHLDTLDRIYGPF